MKLWLDDYRLPPDETWTWVRTSQEAITYLFNTIGKIEEISFDHDLGGDDTALPVANVLENFAFYGMCPRIAWRIHSDNPAGRAAIQLAMTQADKYWTRNENSGDENVENVPRHGKGLQD